MPIKRPFPRLTPNAKSQGFGEGAMFKVGPEEDATLHKHDEPDAGGWKTAAAVAMGAKDMVVNGGIWTTGVILSPWPPAPAPCTAPADSARQSTPCTPPVADPPLARAQLLVLAIICASLVNIVFIVVLKQPPPGIQILGKDIFQFVPTPIPANPNWTTASASCADLSTCGCCTLNQVRERAGRPPLARRLGPSHHRPHRLITHLTALEQIFNASIQVDDHSTSDYVIDGKEHVDVIRLLRDVGCTLCGV